MTVARSRTSAKAAGSRFETQITQCLSHHLNDDRIERRRQMGAKDCGDVAGVRVHGQRVVIEAKDCARMDLASWVQEAQTEAENDGALLGVVIHKRVRKGDALDQYVTMTVREFVSLLTGEKVS